MTSKQLERRLAAVERELASLKSKLEQMTGSTPWWERIVGTFHDDAVYKKAMRLGQQYRRSCVPGSSARKQK